MANTQTKTARASDGKFETPTDEPEPKRTRKVPNRGTRKRVLGQGEGDYCIFVVAPEGSDLPQGALIPVPDTPRFGTATEASRWLREHGAPQLAGKKIMIFKAAEVIDVDIEQRPRLVLRHKPKIDVPSKVATESE